jgi:transcriptional regulator with PAS, ATPase and Fis domain
MEDIPLLIDHFIRIFNTIQNKSLQGVDDEALSCLMSYHYPGNVRELENIIERAFIICKSGIIQTKDLPEFLRANSQSRDAAIPAEHATFRDVEAAFLVNALRRNNGNRTQTARELGIHKSTLFRRIKSLGIKTGQTGNTQRR